jgi:hypothetical protein
LDFNETVGRCIGEAVTDVLGASVAEGLFTELWEHYDISREDVAYRLETLFMVLEEVFSYTEKGKLSKLIIRKLLTSLSPEVIETLNGGLQDCLKEAKSKDAKGNIDQRILEKTFSKAKA